MGDISEWIQNYWFELSSLILQLAILSTLVWFGRKALAALGSSPRRAEAPEPQPAEYAPAEPSREFHGGLRGLISMEQEAGYAAPQAAHAAAGGADAWHAIVRWLNTPMKSGATAPWRRVTRQAPEPQPAEYAAAEPSREFHGGLRGLIPMEQEAGYAAPQAVHAVAAVADPLRAIVRWLNTPMRGGAPWRRVTRQVS
jgi:hypothetical protein